jgi:hypothetical protein
MARAVIRTRAPTRAASVVILSFACAFGAFGALGCGSSGGGAVGTFSGPPVANATTDTGTFTIDARTSPNPIARGINALELTVKDKTGAPKDGLAMSAVTWMPAMGHGASVVPTVTPKGGGVYDLENVDLFMPGRWEVRLTIGSPATDHSTLVFDIP